MSERICYSCGKMKPISAFQTGTYKCRACYAVISRVRYRQRFLSMYGGVCSCCQESDPRFLTLDHINGREEEEFEKSKNYEVMVNAVKNFRPDLYQILCFNCNCGRSVNGGICPHKDKSKEEYLAWVDDLLEKQIVTSSISPEEMQRRIMGGLLKKGK